MRLKFEMTYKDLENICPMLKKEVKLKGKEKIFIETIATKTNFLYIIAYKEKIPLAAAKISTANKELFLYKIEVSSKFKQNGISTLIFAFYICLIRYAQIKYGIKQIDFFAPTDPIKELLEEKFGFPPKRGGAETTPKILFEYASEVINLKKLNKFIKSK